MDKHIDWHLLKLQYEIFGESLQDLADQYDLSLHVLKYAAEEQNWRRLPIAKAINNWKDYDSLEDIPDDLVDSVQERMSLLLTLKQSALNPRYIAIEAALLGKAQMLVESIDPEHPNAAAVLKSLGELFVGMRNAAAPMLQSKESEESAKLIVNVAGQVTAGPEQIEGGVERTTPLVEITKPAQQVQRADDGN